MAHARTFPDWGTLNLGGADRRSVVNSIYTAYMVKFDLAVPYTIW
jgi:hypothetical protein